MMQTFSEGRVCCLYLHQLWYIYGARFPTNRRTIYFFKFIFYWNCSHSNFEHLSLQTFYSLLCHISCYSLVVAIYMKIISCYFVIRIMSV